MYRLTIPVGFYNLEPTPDSTLTVDPRPKSVLDARARASVFATEIEEDFNPASFRTLEEIPISQVQSFEFFRRDADEAPVLEYVAMYNERYANDVPDVSDVFSRIVFYDRVFSDYLSLDDFASVDKYFTGNKTNVFGFTDDDVWLVGKGLSDDFVAQSAANLGWIKRVLASENYAPATDEIGWEFRKPHVQHDVDVDSYTSLHSGRGLSSGTLPVSIESIDTVKGVLDDHADPTADHSVGYHKDLKTLSSELMKKWGSTGRYVDGVWTILPLSQRAPYFGWEEVSVGSGDGAYWDNDTLKWVFQNPDPSKWLLRTILPDAAEVSEDSVGIAPQLHRWNEVLLNRDSYITGFIVEKLLSDYITLDDFSTIEKHVEMKPYLDVNGEKTNYAFITSQLGFDISRAVSDDSAGFISSKSLELSRGLASDATPTVDQSFIVDKNADDDQAALFWEIDTEFTSGHSSDTPLTDYRFDKDTSKGISDHLNMHHYFNWVGWHFEHRVFEVELTGEIEYRFVDGRRITVYPTIDHNKFHLSDEFNLDRTTTQIFSDPLVFGTEYVSRRMHRPIRRWDDIPGEDMDDPLDELPTSDNFVYTVTRGLRHSQDDTSSATDAFDSFVVDKGLSDSTNHTSTLVRATEKGLSDLTESTSTLVQATEKGLSDSTGPTSTLVQATEKGLSDSTGPTSTLVRDASKGLSDSTGPTSTLVRATEIGLADEAPVTESITVELISAAVVASRTLGGTTFNSNTLN